MEYLNRQWEIETDKSYVSFIYALISDEAKMAIQQVNGMDIDKMYVEYPDCYFSENGDLYVPTVYNEVYKKGKQEDAEMFAEEHILLKTKDQLEKEYDDYLKENA